LHSPGLRASFSGMVIPSRQLPRVHSINTRPSSKLSSRARTACGARLKGKRDEKTKTMDEEKAFLLAMATKKSGRG
ncbi:MAG: hypothetical protein KBH15_05085, partial [Candidatus Atribacteria bacterium]|nr:hypothetical protein [Candidatus Atribacteria bacterium]